MTYVVITSVVLLVLNVYCSIACQNLFFESKKTSMIEKCLLASDEISTLEVLNTSTVSTVIGQIESLKVNRLLVTDQTGCTLYVQEKQFSRISALWEHGKACAHDGF